MIGITHEEHAMSERPAETRVDVAGTKGAYQVSDRGRVRSVGRATKILAQNENPAGYLVVGIKIGGRFTTRGVHRLVAHAFKGKIPPRHIVRHLDGNKANNVPRNLTYVSIRDANKETYADGRNGVLNPDIVRDIRARREAGESTSDIATALKLNRATVGAVLAGDTWSWVK